MKKRKIGLILVPEHTNYGAQLQSYATQQVVEALGCDTEILLYKPNGHRNIKFYWGLIPWYIDHFLKSKHDNRYKNLDEIHAENHRLRKEASKAFMSYYLKNFHECIGYNELVKVGRSYDAVLIGSDQMWPAGVAFGNFISMRFVPKGVKRISYATSCGVTSYPKYCYKSSEDMWREFFPFIPAGSRILFTGSQMVVNPHATVLAYGVAKAAVHALCKNLVKEFEGTGTTVNAVVPGFVETPWQKEKPEEIKQNIYRKTAIHRFATID